MSAPVPMATVGLRAALDGDPYRTYVYGYPHKTAYRALEPAVPLGPVWARERQDALFGYVHLPFCEMRCGFCNLFTTANPQAEEIAAYLDALQREARVVADLLDRPRAARLAIGGGTPTLLAPADLERVLSLLHEVFGAGPAQVPTSVETSPATATTERMRLLRKAGVERVSIGVQSMIDAEVHSVGRPQQAPAVRAALDTIREVGPPSLNIDLMYGLGGQSEGSWLDSLEQILAWAPEEVFCYPLYVRPLTGISGHADWSDHRRALYRIAVDRLGAAGYRQTSMRRFTRTNDPGDEFASGTNSPTGVTAPEYSCQTDAMVGLGCGARSYTRALHWSREYAVRRSGIRRIVADYCATPDDEFALARWGLVLDDEERLRRFVLQSLLHVDGLDLTEATHVVGHRSDVVMGQLAQLVDAGLVERRVVGNRPGDRFPAGEGVGNRPGDRLPAERLCLTPAGLELSDAIGPWLHSPRVTDLSAGHELR